MSQHVVCLYLLPLVSILAAASCPDGCVCADQLYRCELDGSIFTLKAGVNDFAEITCIEGPLPSILPTFPIPTSQPLSSLSISGCGARSLHVVLRALGASGARRVRVRTPGGEVTDEELVALEGVEVLQLDDNEFQTKLPLEAFANLTSLRQVRINGARLLLNSGPSPVNHQLEYLELVAAGAGALPAGALRGLKGLRGLVVAASDLAVLEKGAFQGLDQLQTLDLNRNPLRELPGGVLCDAPNLVTLAVKGGSLELVAGDALTGLQHLEEIIIQTGRSTLTLEPGSFSNLPALRLVTLLRTPLTPLPEDLFSGSWGVLKLSIAECGLETLPEAIFKDLGNLTHLDLRGNMMVALGQLLWPLRRLQHLDLAGNRLSVLHKDTFAGLTDLLTLHLDHNQLSTIEVTTFRGPRALTTLTISSNQLTLQDAVNRSQGDQVASPFMYLYHLQELDLSRNNISVICDDWRKSWVEIRVINLSWNRIRRLKIKDIQFLANVTVDLRHNEIASIDIGPHLQHHPDATFLLDHNPINCDCTLYPFINYTVNHQKPIFKFEETSCTSPPELHKTLLPHISSDKLTCKVDIECPQNCSCLKQPSSSLLELDCLMPPSLKDYPILRFHNLTSSKLTLRKFVDPIELPDHVYSLNLSNLNLFDVPFVPDAVTELDLRLNPIKVIPTWLSKRENIHLYLPNNSLTCDCSTKDNLKSLHKYNVIDFDTIVCENGRLLAKIDVDAICNVFHARIIGGILATIGLLSIIAAVVIYRNVKTVKEFLYKMGWELFVVEEEVDGKRFDVLVSYSDDYEKYVVQKLVPTLEEEGYSVCVRYRDWDIGDWIPGKVAKLVEKSRRTVVLLSKEYLNSLPCLELRAALMAEQRGKWKRVLLVVTKDLEPDPHLKAFLSTGTCLDLEDESFWTLLRRKLPKRRERKVVRSPLAQKALNIQIIGESLIDSSKKSLER